ncbi:hypothetical protein ASPFODRAFT_44742 [Aspergillus luchuensis CBS 106.47]|uniref:Uncharacterized protein n=1 Tax=Aspergillus luchuensis (strain CBS 106.47) TaxID=1137211 RepID=A0A1M3TJY3_ASPLC|nr:hypothetical protein ASPFODRAFT_44742 [Aspergillus luchuensis CBS 106.47]
MNQKGRGRQIRKKSLLTPSVLLVFSACKSTLTGGQATNPLLFSFLPSFLPPSPN